MDRSARFRSSVGVVCGIASVLAWFAAVIILTGVIDDVFLDHADATDVRQRIVLLLGLILLRAVLAGTGEWAGETAAASLVRTLRGQITASMFGVGPVALRGQRSGDLVRLAGDGVESLGP